MVLAAGRTTEAAAAKSTEAARSAVVGELRETATKKAAAEKPSATSQRTIQNATSAEKEGRRDDNAAAAIASGYPHKMAPSISVAAAAERRECDSSYEDVDAVATGAMFYRAEPTIAAAIAAAAACPRCAITPTTAGEGVSANLRTPYRYTQRPLYSCCCPLVRIRTFYAGRSRNCNSPWFACLRSRYVFTCSRWRDDHRLIKISRQTPRELHQQQHQQQQQPIQRQQCNNEVEHSCLQSEAHQGVFSSVPQQQHQLLQSLAPEAVQWRQAQQRRIQTQQQQRMLLAPHQPLQQRQPFVKPQQLLQRQLNVLLQRYLWRRTQHERDSTSSSSSASSTASAGAVAGLSHFCRIFCRKTSTYVSCCMLLVVVLLLFSRSLEDSPLATEGSLSNLPRRLKLLATNCKESFPRWLWLLLQVLGSVTVAQLQQSAAATIGAASNVIYHFLQSFQLSFVGLFLLFFVVALPGILIQIESVVEESVEIIADFGVQFEKKRRWGGVERLFIDASKIYEVFLHEGIRMCDVVFYVALLVEGHAAPIVPFTHFSPSLQENLIFYESLHYLLLRRRGKRRLVH